jgi:alpha-1,3-rhamnosyl/mannosyltransferase
MACGVPVVCHRGTSLPEVGGDAPIYADATRDGEFCAALRLLFSSREIRLRCIDLGLKRARQYSWTVTAAKTLEVYAQTLEREEERRCA